MIQKGNTEIVAEMVAQQTGGTLFKIQPATPYPQNYKETTEIAQREKNEKARPAITGKVDNMADYDVIFLGYPIWWGDMPMAVYTFLEGYNLAGKTIIPFSTHEGSGLGSTVQNIRAAVPNATIGQGLAIRGSVAQNSRDEARSAVTSWLRGLGYEK